MEIRKPVTTPSILSALQKVSKLLTAGEKLKCLGIVGFALCTSLFEVVTASVIVIFAQVINDPQAGHKYLSMVGLGSALPPGRIILYFALIVGTIFLIKNLFAAGEAFYQNFSIHRMKYHFKNKLLHRYAQADYGFYLTRNSTLSLQVVGGDAEIMFTNGMIPIASILSESVIFSCLIGMVIYMNPSLAFAIFAIGAILGFGLTKGVLPRFYRFGQKLQEASLYSSQNLIQFFHAFKEIVLAGKREAFIDAYKFYSRKTFRIQATQMTFTVIPRLAIEVMFVGLFVTTIAILCLEHESPAKMIGVLSGYLYAGFRLMPGLNRIINQLNVFKSTIPSIERVYQEYTTVAAKENYVDIPELQFHHQINFKGVSFRYLNTNKDALSNLIFQINKGESLGIVGETGSGKSTLVDILLGLLKPYQGSVLIDDKYAVNSYQWHERVGYVPQSIYLTDDTVEANIAFGERDIDHARLNAAIDAAQLRRFIDQLPQGSKTLVGERGTRLSGGERQRIAIARALYRNPDVLIFDEATSALDNATEARLMETINEVSKDRTIIMIAHRLTTLKDCDRILKVENGCLTQIDSNA